MKESDHSILITGVSSGIGYDLVKYMINKGYFVFGSVRKQEDFDKLQNEFPDRFMCLLFDVTNKEQIEQGLIRVKEQLGERKLSGLVNNAGLSLAGPISLIPDDQFDEQFAVNVKGIRFVTNTFLPLLGTDKALKGLSGKIINISSLSGVFNTPFNGSYCVSKHAVQSLSEVYRRELLDYGIDVVTILPGPIQTEIWGKNIGLMDAYKDSDYGQVTANADEIIKKSHRDALPASVISKLVFKILNKKKPKTKYLVSKNLFFAKLIIYWVPSRWMDRLIWNRLKKGRR